MSTIIRNTDARVPHGNANSPTRAREIAVTPQALVAFACGCLNDVTVRIIGEYYLSELLVLIAAVGILIIKGSNGAFKSRLFRAFMITGWITFLGYMISDLYAGTEAWQYLKGWGRTGILIADCFALMVITIQNRQNLWWFMLGTGLGGIVYLHLTGVPIEVWKLGYGERVTSAFLTLLALFPRMLWPIALLCWGVINIYLDYRNLGAATIATGAITIGSKRNRTGTYIKPLVVSGVLALAFILIALSLTQKEYYVRREDSFIGRTAAIVVALRAIAHSPIIGHGSWTVNEEIASSLRKEIEKRREGVKGSEQFNRLHSGNVFLPHSQVLQAWIEGGILGAVFFLFYGYQLARSLAWVALHRGLDAFTPVFLFTLILGLWNLIASPILGSSRMQLAIAVSVIMAMEFERLRKPIDLAPAPAPASKTLDVSINSAGKGRILRLRT